MAADMPLKAPILDPWVGPYVSGNVGYGWGSLNTTATVDPFTFASGSTFFTFPGGGGPIRLDPNGIKAGGEVGYVWRWAPHWLSGVDADFQWSGEKASGMGAFSGNFGFPASISNCTSFATPASCSYTNTTDITASLSWFGSFRFRGGYEANGLWFYGTVGPAFGRVAVSGTNTLNVVGSIGGPVFTYTSVTPFSYSTTRLGAIGGVGVEGLIGTSNHWRWKAEYLCLDLGSIGGGSFGVFNVSAGKFIDEIFRVGIIYNFGTL